MVIAAHQLAAAFGYRSTSVLQGFITLTRRKRIISQGSTAIAAGEPMLKTNPLNLFKGSSAYHELT